MKSLKRRRLAENKSFFKTQMQNLLPKFFMAFCRLFISAGDHRLNNIKAIFWQKCLRRNFFFSQAFLFYSSLRLKTFFVASYW